MRVGEVRVSEMQNNECTMRFSCVILQFRKFPVGQMQLSTCTARLVADAVYVLCKAQKLNSIRALAAVVFACILNISPVCLSLFTTVLLEA